jgi:hypothetical protein
MTTSILQQNAERKVADAILLERAGRVLYQRSRGPLALLTRCYLARAARRLRREAGWNG